MKTIFTYLIKTSFLLTLCIASLSLHAIENDTTVVYFSLDDCKANFRTGSNQDYSEFVADINMTANGPNVNVLGNYLYRANPEMNTHSCTPGVDGSAGMCFKAFDICEYDPSSVMPLVVDLEIKPLSGRNATLHSLAFYEQSIPEFSWIDGDSGPNNRPQFYAVRILKNGVEILRLENQEASEGWTLESFEFSEMEEFTIEESATFTFEFSGYCPVDIGANISVWDVDEFNFVVTGTNVLPAEIEGGPFEFCVGDGEADFIGVDEITVTGGLGSGSQWVVTDEELNILSLPANIEDLNFDETSGGTCLIWYLKHADDLTGAEVGANAGDLGGCFALSNSITVVRNEVGAATLEGGPFEFCVGDGTADMIGAGEITVSGGVGASAQWVITDEELNILALPGDITEVNFDESGGGTCLIWYLTYNGELSGAEVEANAGDLEGCFLLSNSITVVRNEVGAATLEGGPFEFCVGDGIEDLIGEDEIAVTPGIGENTQWVITDENLKILALPTSFSDINYDNLDGGICQIWYLTYNGEISGLILDANAANLRGCYALSNSVTIIKNEVIPAILGGGPFVFCVGDGIADIVADGEISVIEGQGENNQWVVTDDQLNILALPDNYSDVNFDLNESGICLITNVTWFGDISGLEVGNNTGDLDGCYSFSNSVSVVRYDPEPAVLSGGPFEFCVGDDEADMIMDDGILVSGGSGESAQWIITDQALNILDLPSHYTEVNFDDAPIGNCLIWYLTYSGSISGLELAANAGDLVGCYELSNSIAVDRVDCSSMGIGSLSEINFNGDIEIINIGNDTLDLTNYYLCQFPVYRKIGDLNIVCGSGFKLAPGEIITVASTLDLIRADGEMGLYSGNTFTSSDLIVDYVEWGSTGHTRSSVAVSAGIWTMGDFVAAVSGTNSLLYDGEGDASSDWSEGTSTPCAANIQDPERNRFNVRAYPNPANDILNLEISNYPQESFDIRVLNFQGSVVMEKLNQNHNFNRVNIQNLSPGNYLILISGKGVYETKKVLIIK